MPEKHLFEYAVIRVVPRVEREEFLNIGVILYCPKEKYLRTVYHIDEPRIRAVAPKLDIDELSAHLRAFEQISSGDKAAGLIGGLDIASRFRWLTATRSTVLQSSKVHPGLCSEPEKALQKLFRELVL